MSDEEVLFRNRRVPRAGDVVVLKSGGGPRMVIASVSNAGTACCRFFRENGNLDYHNIESSTLRIVEYGDI